MNVLVVFAHPEPKSLNGTLKDIAVKKLKEIGNKVKVSDLYQMKFKAILDPDDFLELENSDRFSPVMEQIHAAQTNSFASDIKEEMERVKWAEELMVLTKYQLFPAGEQEILKI